jgi:FtsP/CotA-like multicopper oxidase with cupredoxin domain
MTEQSKTKLQSHANTDTSRRRFLTVAGALGFGAVGSTLAPDSIRGMNHAAQASAQHDHDVALSQKEETTWQEMDKMHEEGILRFPAETSGLGGQPLEYQMDGDVKVFNLTTAVTPWEWDTDQWVDAWTYNGVVPGPEIRVTEGDKVRIIVKNNLPESHAVHWHGLIVPNNMDGVPFITQPPIPPGGVFFYEFQIREGNFGSHMYHSHLNSAYQVQMGLLGAFIVEPKNPDDYPDFDREYTMVLNEGPIAGYSINGKGFPATQPFMAVQGEKILIRYMNEGAMIHPMHLHGMPQQVIATDGWLLPQPYMADTINVAPGQRIDVLVDATELGVWAFHCHILSHAESAHGMFGMVTALIVTEPEDGSASATPAP